MIYREIQYDHWRALYRLIDEPAIDYLNPGSGKVQTRDLWTSDIPGGAIFCHWHDGRDAGGMDGLFEKTGTTEGVQPADPETIPLLRIIQCGGYIVHARFLGPRLRTDGFVAWLSRIARLSLRPGS
jgi:hypothetical protein